MGRSSSRVSVAVASAAAVVGSVWIVVGVSVWTASDVTPAGWLSAGSGLDSLAWQPVENTINTVITPSISFRSAPVWLGLNGMKSSLEDCAASDGTDCSCFICFLPLGLRRILFSPATGALMAAVSIIAPRALRDRSPLCKSACIKYIPVSGVQTAGERGEPGLTPRSERLFS